MTKSICCERCGITLAKFNGETLSIKYRDLHVSVTTFDTVEVFCRICQRIKIILFRDLTIKMQTLNISATDQNAQPAPQYVMK
jgi:hypothetical protein